MKKIISAILIITICSSPAMADSETVRKVATGLAIFGLLASNSQPNSQVQQQLIEAKNKVRETAENAANVFASAIPEKTPQEALEIAMQSFRKDGKDAQIEESEYNPGNNVMTAIDAQGNTTEIEVDETMNTVTVTISIPQFGISEKAKREFNPKKKRTPLIIEETKFSMIDVAGFEVADKGRSPDGYLILTEIRSGGAMANLGALRGADLYSVDGKSTKQLTAQELRDYVKSCRNNRHKITVTFMDINGNEKTIDVRLQ